MDIIGVMHVKYILLIVVLLMPFAAAQEIGQDIIIDDPRIQVDPFCANDRLRVASNDGLLQLETCDGICDSGECLPAACTDGIQNGDETGVDCGGDCPSQCVDCIRYDSEYFPIGVPTSDNTQTGPRFLQLADDEVLVRAYDVLFEWADENNVPVSSLDTSDEVMEAVAWYVDEHMSWRSDNTVNPECINEVNNLNYDAGWDFPIPASYTARFTAHPGCQCSNDFCGDCDDHAILRQALTRRIGVEQQCIWDAIDLQSPGKHEYNVAYYQGKFRIMDYGDMDSNLDSTWNAHDTQWGWNYAFGPRPTTSQNLQDRTQNYPDGVDCDDPGWNNDEYRESICP